MQDAMPVTELQLTELELTAISKSLEDSDSLEDLGDNVFVNIDPDFWTELAAPTEPLQLMEDKVTSFPKQLLNDTPVIALAHKLRLDSSAYAHAERIAKGLPATATPPVPFSFDMRRELHVRERSKGSCMYPGCTTKAHGRGLCTKHGGCTKVVCVHPDCSTKAQARGLCFKHRPVVTPVKDEKFFLRRFKQAKHAKRCRERAKLHASLDKAV